MSPPPNGEHRHEYRREEDGELVRAARAIQQMPDGVATLKAWLKTWGLVFGGATLLLGVWNAFRPLPAEVEAVKAHNRRQDSMMLANLDKTTRALQSLAYDQCKGSNERAVILRTLRRMPPLPPDSIVDCGARVYQRPDGRNGQ